MASESDSGDSGDSGWSTAVDHQVMSSIPPLPIMGRTENNSATYITSTNPCVDFFFQIVPDSPPDRLTTLLQQSWAHDPLTSLKLICNLRGVRGTGKSDKENFYTSAVWLYENHPKTLASSVETFAQFGYLKDLPEILCRILEGPEPRRARKQEYMERKEAKGRGRRRKFYFLSKKKKKKKKKKATIEGGAEEEEDAEIAIDDDDSEEDEMAIDDDDSEEAAKKRAEAYAKYRQEREEREQKKKEDDEKAKKEEVEKKRELRAQVPREDRVAKNMEKVKAEMERARNLRKEKDLNMAKRASQMYNSDENFRFLHDQVSELFAKLLVSDMKRLGSGEMEKISLAAKWCPSIDSSYDKATLMCKSIAKRMFFRELSQEYEGLSEEDFERRLRDRLRKEVLVPLRQALKLPEVYMSARRWELIQYDRVASVAMKNYTDIFLHRDNKRFKDYLAKVAVGDAKIAAGALLPHEIIKGLGKSSGVQLVTELQWKRLVSDMLNKGKLTNCLAICDVSGSMWGTPMEVCVALGLLVSELSEEPWKGHVITFSNEPELHSIEGGDLRSKTKFIREMNAGYNTDFQKVFDKILEVALSLNLSEDQMIKRLFVFSDMEFDEATRDPFNQAPDDQVIEAPQNTWETDYQAIQRKFREKGYQRVPEIVFWNLGDSSATPVTASENGVALVSGFSKNLLTLFMEEDGAINPEHVSNLQGGDAKSDAEKANEEMNPESVMEAAIAGELYQNLVVCD